MRHDGDLAGCRCYKADCDGLDDAGDDADLVACVAWLGLEVPPTNLHSPTFRCSFE